MAVKTKVMRSIRVPGSTEEVLSLVFLGGAGVGRIKERFLR